MAGFHERCQAINAPGWNDLKKRQSATKAVPATARLGFRVCIREIGANGP